MLYDPKWDFIVEIKPTLDGFIKWLELQPAGATYFYSDLKNCALGQYYRSLGLTPRLYDEEIFPDTNLQARMLFDPASLLADAKTTFGFALKNLRAMRNNEIVVYDSTRPENCRLSSLPPRRAATPRNAT